MAMGASRPYNVLSSHSPRDWHSHLRPVSTTTLTVNRLFLKTPVALTIRHLLITLCALATANSIVADEVPQGWYDDQRIEINDRARYFRYYLPSKPSSASPPLVLFLHGGNASMRESMPPFNRPSAAWADVAEENGFILMVPNGVNRITGNSFGDEQSWNDCRPDNPLAITLDDVRFIDRLIDLAINDLGADDQRVFVTGSSNGGLLTYRVAVELADRVTAAAAFIANMPVESTCPTPTRPMPMMIVNGTQDSLMPFDGGEVADSNTFLSSTPASVDQWRSVNRAGAAPIVTDLPDSDPSDGSTVERVDYPAPASGAPVVLLRMNGADHAMPSPSRRLAIPRQNHDVEGAEIAWAFFQDQAAFPTRSEGQWVPIDPEVDGANQGLTIDVLPSLDQMFVAWFTYTSEADPEASAIDLDVGAADNRWLTAQLAISGDQTSGSIFESSGGIFEAPPTGEESTQVAGTLSIDFIACDRAEVTYTLSDAGLTGQFSIQPLEAAVSAGFACTP